jgi:hypothetical protein
MKVTRRKLARILAAAAAVPGVAAPQAPSAVSSGDEDLNTAREQLRNNAQQLAKVNLPMATEPAFRFKA